MQDVAGRISNRIQLTTDGHRVYAEAVEQAFGSEIDYAMLVKIYGASNEANHATVPQRASDAARGCSPGIQIRTHLYQLCGTSEPQHENGDAPFY